MSDSESIPADAREERIDHVVGDRVCDMCGFNLFGQPIIRERHYGMFIARCPECGQATSMQESPRATRWSGRMTALLAAVWILCLFGALAGTVGAFVGFSSASASVGSDAFAEAIRSEHQAWQEQEKGIDPTEYQQMFGWGRIDGDWLKVADLEETFTRAGGFRFVASRLVGVWVSLCIVLFILGVFWSTALMHTNRLRIMLLGLAPVLISVSLLLLTHRSMQASAAFSLWVTNVALAHVAARTMIYTALLGTAAFMLGLWFGRPVARLLVVFLLAPRLRAPLARLWLCDGKDFPAPRRGRGGPIAPGEAQKKGPAPKSAGPVESEAIE